MKTEILIYALSKDETERHMEDLLSTQCKSKEEVNALIEKARKDGWHSFRISGFTPGEMPDFKATVKKQ